jgi:hypothetical protein
VRNLLITAAIVASLSTPAMANPTLNPFSAGCLTEDLAKQFSSSLYSHDMGAMAYLLDHGCSVSDKPLKVTVLELSSWGAYAHVRVYRGKHAIEVWTPRNNLDGYDPLNP